MACGGTAVTLGGLRWGAHGTGHQVHSGSLLVHARWHRSHSRWLAVSPGTLLWLAVGCAHVRMAPGSLVVARSGIAVTPDGLRWVVVAPQSLPVACGEPRDTLVACSGVRARLHGTGITCGCWRWHRSHSRWLAVARCGTAVIPGGLRWGAHGTGHRVHSWCVRVALGSLPLVRGGTSWQRRVAVSDECAS